MVLTLVAGVTEVVVEVVVEMAAVVVVALGEVNCTDKRIDNGL
jgi:phenylpyruvate tautomerase PptA (4-oxalocrotonate tautomerase family)